jgi:plastocyanin
MAAMKLCERLHFSVVICTLIAVGIGCGGGSPESSSQTPAAGAQARPTDTADGPGVITGTISLDGAIPTPRPLRMDSDPKCVADPGAMSETLLVGPDGGVQNVLVYVKDGLGARTYPVPTTPVTLDQKGCRYSPHVFGVQVGQPVMISNSDATLHNVNAAPKNNRAFNFGQPASVPAVARTFDKPEVMIPLRCDVHGWMNAYVGVVAHPFFAVTKDDCRFEIKGLPAGTYTIEAWHEQLGTQTQSVTVDAQAPAKVAIAFKPTI